MITTGEATQITVLMAVNSPCRICGEKLTNEDLDEAYYAGYSKCNTALLAHEKCWESNKPKTEWAYPEDAA
jgi:hypothetical protein